MKYEYKNLEKFANRLRKHTTLAERNLRDFLIKYKIPHEWNFIISPYIVDFFFREKNLVFEIDGIVHKNKTKEIKDLRREEYLMSFDIMVIRFKNSDSPSKILNCYHTFRRQSFSRRLKLTDKIDRARSFFNIPELSKEYPYTFGALYFLSKDYKRKKNREKRLRKKEPTNERRLLFQARL